MDLHCFPASRHWVTVHVKNSMLLAVTIGCDSVVVLAELFQWVTLAKLDLEAPASSGVTLPSWMRMTDAEQELCMVLLVVLFLKIKPEIALDI